MIRYNSAKQLTIEEFKTPFQIGIDKENRWVKLSEKVPWDELADIYYRNMSQDMGAPAIDARIVIGSLIVKHKLTLDDREVIETIKENMYIQYFLGLSNYTYEELFDRSLFTTFRYRMGAEKFDAMTCELIERSEAGSSKRNNVNATKGEAKRKKDEKQKGGEKDDAIRAAFQDDQPTEQKNQGKLLLDATVADQMIAYPTDLNLVNRSREESERIIDLLCKELKVTGKPRTYRKKARKEYLNTAKKKNKSTKELHKATGKQLRFLRRNLKSVNNLLDKADEMKLPFPLKHRDQKIFWVIQHVYDQQMSMYANNTHSVEDRIVNIYQPYVRPIVRGKDKAKVEFGSKIGVGLDKGFARINTLSWDAYNENIDLPEQVEMYKTLHGYYPEVVITDKIYGTQKNRLWLKERGIRFSGKPLGRPTKETLSPYQKRKQKKEQGERNQIEGKFGQGKNAYNLNKVRTRTSKTSESWVAAIMFVMNLIKFDKVFLFIAICVMFGLNQINFFLIILSFICGVFSLSQNWLWRIMVSVSKKISSKWNREFFNCIRNNKILGNSYVVA